VTNGFRRRFDGSEREPSSWTSLRSLSLEFNRGMGMESWKFVRSLSTTLETLDMTLSIKLSADLIAETDSPSPAFPNLRRLALFAQDSTGDIISLLKLFSAAPIRHLVLLVYSLEAPSSLLLETALRLFPTTLQSVRIEYLRTTSADHLHSLAPTLRSLASARNISFTLAPTYDIYLHRPSLVTSG
jgi:hypothetical protein